MADPFVGELRLVGFNFAPLNWATADGQLLPISRYTALFSLLGVNFGGNGTSTFGLPNLQGSIPVGAGQGPGLTNYSVGETGGVNPVTLLQSEMPAHTHSARADTSAADQPTPVSNAFAKPATSVGNLYGNATGSKVQMNTSIVTVYGNSLPHNNLMPYLTLNWIISMAGVFPQRS